MRACAYVTCVESATYRVQCRVEIPGTRLGSFHVDALMLCGKHMRHASERVEWIVSHMNGTAEDATTTTSEVGE